MLKSICKRDQVKCELLSQEAKKVTYFSFFLLFEPSKCAYLPKSIPGTRIDRDIQKNV